MGRQQSDPGLLANPFKLTFLILALMGIANFIERIVNFSNQINRQDKDNPLTPTNNKGSGRDQHDNELRKLGFNAANTNFELLYEAENIEDLTRGYRL